MVTRQAVRSHRRGGMTLLEAVVVIAVLSVLVALLVPAVQRVRESAARAQCQRNLEQIGIALHHYHDVSSTFPPGVAVTRQRKDEVAGSFFWGYFLLPYLDQGAIYGQIPFKMAKGAGPDWTVSPSKEAQQVAISVYRCPSSSDAPAYKVASFEARFAGSYGAVLSGTAGNPTAGNNGVGDDSHDDQRHFNNNKQYSGGGIFKGHPGFAELPSPRHPRFNGVFFRNSDTKLGDILDGSSNTVGIGERYRNVEPTDFPNPHMAANYGYWMLGGLAGNNKETPGTVAHCFGQALGSIGIPINFDAKDTAADRHTSWGGFRSRHSGGANFLFMDGSVRFLANDTSDQVRRALGTIRGAETASPP